MGAEPNSNTFFFARRSSTATLPEGCAQQPAHREGSGSSGHKQICSHSYGMSFVALTSFSNKTSPEGIRSPTLIVDLDMEGERSAECCSDQISAAANKKDGAGLAFRM